MEGCDNGNDVSIWLWAYIPIIILLVIVLIVISYFFPVFSDNYYVLDGVRHYSFNLADALLNEEKGFVEVSTVIILIPAIIFGWCSFKSPNKLINKKIRAWFFLIFLTCVYFAGEEISWGQHLFGWETPLAIKKINDQNETNIHNISSWFDQKPRMLFEIWVLFCGIIIPAIAIIKNKSLSKEEWRYWFYPSWILMPTACIAILIKVPERIDGLINLNLIKHHVRYSEIQELYFAYFLMLYLLVIYKRLNEDKAALN